MNAEVGGVVLAPVAAVDTVVLGDGQGKVHIVLGEVNAAEVVTGEAVGVLVVVDVVAVGVVGTLGVRRGLPMQETEEIVGVVLMTVQVVWRR